MDQVQQNTDAEREDSSTSQQPQTEPNAGDEMNTAEPVSQLNIDKETSHQEATEMQKSTREKVRPKHLEEFITDLPPSLKHA